MSDLLTRAEFVRRNLRAALGLGAAAVIAKTITPTPAKAWGDCDADDPCGCFLKGTKIATPDGERVIEQLVPGELVTTLNGPRAVKAIHYIQSLEGPVLIRRAAFDADIPNRDLYVTPGHAIWTAGCFATAESLCNGDTILKLPSVGRQDYYHLELAHHGVIYAHGLTCESRNMDDTEYFLTLGSRRSRIKSHLRSAFSPWIDRRQPIDRVRDRLGA